MQQQQKPIWDDKFYFWNNIYDNIYCITMPYKRKWDIEKIQLWFNPWTKEGSQKKFFILPLDDFYKRV